MISFRAVRTLCRVGGLGWLASRSISSAACQPSSAVTVGYASDVEGDFDYWQRYIHHSHVVYRDDSSHELRLRENSMFVFGGDVCDRGPGDLRIMRDIIFLKERYPDRVFIVLGNRDVNKLRLPFSLHPAVVRSCTPGAYWIRSERQKQFAQNEVKKNCQISKLHWVLEQTMGSPNSFHFRLRELEEMELSHVGEQSVLESYLDSLRPASGLLAKFLRLGQVALVLGDVLFVHGSIDDYNHGWIPGDMRQAGASSHTCSDPRTWVQEINSFARRELQEYCDTVDEHLDKMHSSADPSSLVWEYKGGYASPQPGSRLLQYAMGWTADRAKNPTVISSSYLEQGKANPIGSAAAEWLKSVGITRVVVGHQPHGDAPQVMDSHGVQTISADTAYSRSTQWPRDYLVQWAQQHRPSWTPPPGEGQSSKDGFISIADFLGESAGKMQSTRSDATISEVLLTLREGGSELAVHGVLSDGSRYRYTMPPSAQNRIVGRPLSDGWMVKVPNVAVRTKDGERGQEKFAHLLCHSDGHIFRNKWMSDRDVQNELATTTREL